MQWLYILYTQVYVCCCFRTECVEPTKTRLQVLLTMSKFHLEPNVPWKFYHSPWKAKHLTCWLMFFFGPTFLCRNFEENHSKFPKKHLNKLTVIYFFLPPFFESKSAATCWNNTKLEGRVLQYGHGGHSHGRCVADDLGVVSTWWNPGRSD